MAAGKYDITIERGATFSLVLTYKDSTDALINLTGYTARMQIRRKIGDATFLLELTTENGRIALGGALGTITLSASAATTNELAGSGVYDLEIISSGGQVTRVIEGKVHISDNVTR
jgi:hypothetical protein